MSESKHIREPLMAVGPDEDGCWDVRRPDTPDGHRVIAACLCTEARAKLFAAAPDLLAATEHAEAVMTIVMPRSDTEEYLQTLRELRDAIALAKGRAP